jgi:cholesterol oxidase
MGGAVIGERLETGVVDGHQRAFGYENLLVCDGSAIPANIGVNPSLTITAMAEHAMSHIPEHEPRSAQADTDMDVAPGNPRARSAGSPAAPSTCSSA